MNNEHRQKSDEASDSVNGIVKPVENAHKQKDFEPQIRPFHERRKKQKKNHNRRNGNAIVARKGEKKRDGKADDFLDMEFQKEKRSSPCREKENVIAKRKVSDVALSEKFEEKSVNDRIKPARGNEILERNLTERKNLLKSKNVLEGVVQIARNDRALPAVKIETQNRNARAERNQAADFKIFPIPILFEDKKRVGKRG